MNYSIRATESAARDAQIVPGRLWLFAAALLTAALFFGSLVIYARRPWAIDRAEFLEQTGQDAVPYLLDMRAQLQQLTTRLDEVEARLEELPNCSGRENRH